MACLKLNGNEWAWGMRELLEACKIDHPADTSQEYEGFPKTPRGLTELRIEDFALDTAVTARLIELFQKHSNTLCTLTLDECTGHNDILLAVGLTSLQKLRSLTIIVGRISTTAFDSYANALGATLPRNDSLRQLTLKAGSNVFFTLSTNAAQSLAHGLSRNSALQQFSLIGCRFEESSALASLARGIRRHCFLKEVHLHSCFQSNGHVLGDASMAELLFAIGENNRQLQVLDLRGNQCLSASITAVAKLLYRTSIQRLNLSSQCVRVSPAVRHHQEIEYDEDFASVDQDAFMDLSLIVAALSRTNTLQELDLRYNNLCDSDMPYIVASLKQNTSIQTIGLGNNSITNVGISILASELASINSLRHIDLTNNKYDRCGLIELAQAIKQNERIESFELDDCPEVSVDGVNQEGSCFATRVIRYYTDLNASGRYHLNQLEGGHRFLDALWPLVLERASSKLRERADHQERKASIFYTILRRRPYLCLGSDVDRKNNQ